MALPSELDAEHSRPRVCTSTTSHQFHARSPTFILPSLLVLASSPLTCKHPQLWFLLLMGLLCQVPVYYTSLRELMAVWQDWTPPSQSFRRRGGGGGAGALAGCQGVVVLMLGDWESACYKCLLTPSADPWPLPGTLPNAYPVHQPHPRSLVC